MKDKQALLALLGQKRPSLNPTTYAWFQDYLTKQLPPRYAKQLQVDKHHNYSLTILNPTVCFTAHYDTVHRDFGPNELDLSSWPIVATDSKARNGTPLGADDGAGIWLMLQMIKANKAGHYVFFADEECGGIGSSNYAAMPADIKLVMSFDRAGNDEVIIEQGCGVCASFECGQWIADQLNKQNKTFDYATSNLGSFTDSANFADTIPECVNLAVGYESQHTKYEIQDTQHLKQLARALVAIDFGECPIVRRAGDMGYSYSYYESDLETYIHNNPDIVAEFLESIGVTVDEIEAATANKVADPDMPPDSYLKLWDSY